MVSDWDERVKRGILMIPVANKLIYYLRQPQLNFEHDDRQNIFTLRCNLSLWRGTMSCGWKKISFPENLWKIAADKLRWGKKDEKAENKQGWCSRENVYRICDDKTISCWKFDLWRLWILWKWKFSSEHHLCMPPKTKFRWSSVQLHFFKSFWSSISR